MDVYLVWRRRECGYDPDEVSLLGIYSSYELANSAIPEITDEQVKEYGEDAKYFEYWVHTQQVRDSLRQPVGH